MCPVTSRCPKTKTAHEARLLLSTPKGVLTARDRKRPRWSRGLKKNWPRTRTISNDMVGLGAHCALTPTDGRPHPSRLALAIQRDSISIPLLSSICAGAFSPSNITWSLFSSLWSTIPHATTRSIPRQYPPLFPLLFQTSLSCRY